MRAYDVNMQKAETSYQTMMVQMFGGKKIRNFHHTHLNQEKQIMALNDIIAKKNSKIRELEDKINFMSSEERFEASISQHENLPD